MREKGTTGIIFLVTGMVVKNGGCWSFEVEVQWQQVAVSGPVDAFHSYGDKRGAASSRQEWWLWEVNRGGDGRMAEMGWPYMSHDGDEVCSMYGSECSGQLTVVNGGG
ncbi:hypothetical protein L1987_60224 [Smallanthus sonchifolius]|uniref:Uncharacterized protein n=1 Tax=Smallanthus sonchifolius TaxID=185202 RepID=A0ACB9D7F1_9ASTR|nr:hypothetical protein L1987_60224 [Smallanthus sonchifolius]